MKTTRLYSLFFLLTGVMLYLACKKEYSCENCLAAHQPPVANAGNDTSIVLPADSILLDGSKSYDPDDGIAGYTWKIIAGPAACQIINPDSVKTIVHGLVEGIYSFELTVNDKAGLSAKDSIQVTVLPAIAQNHPPIANAGNDTTIVLPISSLTLDGSRSTDPDNNIVSYAWRKIAGPAQGNLANANAAIARLNNPQQGSYVFELTVADAGGLSSKDSVQLVVQNNTANLPPVAIAGPDQDKVLSNCGILLDGDASYDPDGYIVAATWTLIAGVSVMGIVYPDSLVTPLQGFGTGVYVYRLQVTDNQGLTSADTIQITVTNALAGRELIYDVIWGCNDRCTDGDVYWVGGDYCDPNTALEISILLDSSSTWIEVRQEGSPPPAINQFSWKIFNGLLWVNAYDGRLIRTPVKIKAKYL